MADLNDKLADHECTLFSSMAEGMIEVWVAVIYRRVFTTIIRAKLGPKSSARLAGCPMAASISSDAFYPEQEEGLASKDPDRWAKQPLSRSMSTRRR